MGDFSAKLSDAVEKIRIRLSKMSTCYVEAGVFDNDAARIAGYLEYGWVQYVTHKQQWWIYHHSGGTFLPVGTKLQLVGRRYMQKTFQAHGREWTQKLNRAIEHYNYDTAAALNAIGTIMVQDIRQTYDEVVRSQPRRPLTQKIMANANSEAMAGGAGKYADGTGFRNPGTGFGGGETYGKNSVYGSFDYRVTMGEGKK